MSFTSDKWKENHIPGLNKKEEKDEWKQQKTREFKLSRRIWIPIAAITLLVSIIGIGAYLNSLYTYNNVIPFDSAQVLIYEDKALSFQLHSIQWQTCDPSIQSSEYVIIYAFNNGTVPLTLTFQNENFQYSELASYVSMNWNYTGTPLNPGSSIGLEMWLTVGPIDNPPPSLSFDTTIQGYES